VKKRSVGMEEIIKVIKQTSMSRLLLVRNGEDLVVWKESGPRSMKTELKALKMLKSCKNVVRFRGLRCIGDSSFIEMDYLQGRNLEELLSERGCFSETYAKAIFECLATTLLKIHQKGVFHRDLKPSNIMFLLSKLDRIQIKIIDFGVSCFGSSSSKFNKRVGTAEYVCPQIVANESYCASKADVYNLGEILYMLVFGKLPFDMNVRVAAITTKEKQPDLVFPDHITSSIELQDLLSKMLEQSEESRLSMEEVISHPWLGISDSKLLIVKQKGMFDCLFKNKSCDYT